MLNWQDLQVVAVTSRTGSIKGTARELGLSEATIRKKIERLEQVSKAALFIRTPSGLQVTDDGTSLCDMLADMYARSIEVEKAVEDSSKDHLGEVRIVVTEGLGTFWVVPHLIKRQLDHKNISLSFECRMDPPDLRRGEADIAIHYDDLYTDSIVSQKIGEVEIGLYASRSYLTAFGNPETLEDLEGHRFVSQFGPQIDEEAGGAYLPNDAIARATVIRTNTSSAHFYAVANGAGIGALPSYAEAVAGNLERVAFPFALHRPVYVSGLKRRRQVKRVRVVWDWIESAFDSEAYPFFGGGVTLGGVREPSTQFDHLAFE